ncbi:GNAT family N-acetyltransferase [Paenibacillus algorifonticola]|uniref:GNAT family N-acetyltransferase n=1 Tax=Paenibacillus algorifonticola TaxID=684063 RepID=UPI003D2831BB
MEQEQEQGKRQLLKYFQEWITFVAGLEQQEEAVWELSLAPGKWSVREAVAHIALWDRYFLTTAIERLSRQQELTLKHLDYDAFNENARLYGRYTSIAKLIRQTIQDREAIVGIIQALPEQHYAAEYIDSDGHPFRLQAYLTDFIAHDRHHMGQIKQRLDSAALESSSEEQLHLKLEELSMNAWPALQVLMYEGWQLRLANGYTKRSNSIVPVACSGEVLSQKITYGEAFYTARGLDTTYKITPFSQPPELDETLGLRGYDKIDPVYVKTAALAQMREPVGGLDVRIDTFLSEAWLEAYMSMAKHTDDERETLRNMFASPPFQTAFAVLYVEGVPAACGIGVMERGYIGLYAVVTSPDFRRRGFGEQLLLHILQWGKENGAEHSYLLVTHANDAANRLYDKLGFTLQYNYWYRVKKLPASH